MMNLAALLGMRWFSRIPGTYTPSEYETPFKYFYFYSCLFLS